MGVLEHVMHEAARLVLWQPCAKLPYSTYYDMGVATWNWLHLNLLHNDGRMAIVVETAAITHKTKEYSFSIPLHL